MWTFTSHKSIDDQSFSIVPPPDLVKQWVTEVWHEGTPVRLSLSDMHIAGQAATWAANQELEACREWVRSMFSGHPTWADELRAARRPKPPSLKKQAYDALDTYIYGEPDPKDKERTYNTIRRAIEALPND
jgi:hypothetical protein